MNIRSIFIALLLGMILTATTSAALSTLTLSRELEVGLTNDSSASAAVRIENTSNYDFMDEVGGVVSFDLSKLIVEGSSFDLNRRASFTLANPDDTDIFQITNNTDIRLYIGLTNLNVEGISLVGAEYLDPGMASGYHFLIDTDIDHIGEYDAITAKLYITDQIEDAGVITSNPSSLINYSTVTYDFTNMSFDDVLASDIILQDEVVWASSDVGLTSSAVSTYIYVPTGMKEYTVSTVAKLSNTNPSSGGYGVLIDSNENFTSGWVVQFDRGLAEGAIVIRTAKTLYSSTSIFEVRANNSIYLPSKIDNPEWWQQNHELTVSVIVTDETHKKMNIYVDDNFIGSYDFVSSVEEAYTGMRTWSTYVTYESLNITDELIEHTVEEMDIRFTEGVTYDFTSMTPEELTLYAFSGNMTSFEVTDLGLTNIDPYAQIYFPLYQDEYTLTSTATLDDGTNGGYSVYIEGTKADTATTISDGYAIQFDRGWYDGALIVHTKTGESFLQDEGILLVDARTSDLMPTETEDPEWWSAEHEIKVDVRYNSEITKEVSVYVDHVLFGTFEVETTDQPIYTGFRFWVVNTQIESFDISY